MRDLNTLLPPDSGRDVQLLSAVDINEDGWIVGICRTASGNARGYLLIPAAGADAGL